MIFLPLILVACILSNHHDTDEAFLKAPGAVECTDDGTCAPKVETPLEVVASK